MPAPSYSYFVSKLSGTVRDSIADSSEAAYESLPLADALKMLRYVCHGSVRARGGAGLSDCHTLPCVFLGYLRQISVSITSGRESVEAAARPHSKRTTDLRSKCEDFESDIGRK